MAVAAPWLVAPWLVASPAVAQDSAGVDVVVTGTRSPESSQRSVVPTRVVTRDEAERGGATNVAEALANQLGVQVNASAYDHLGNPAGIQIQGFDGERVLILIDGERVIGDTGGVLDLESLPLTDVERIEFVTGPTSSLYGTGAIGGVVNIITGAPKVEGASARVRGEVRSFGAHTQQGSVALRDGARWIMLDGSHTHSPALEREDGSTWLPRAGRYLVGFRAGTQVTPEWETRLKARFIRDDIDGLTIVERPGLGRYRMDVPAFADRISVSAQQALRVTSDSDLRLTVGSQWYINQSRKEYRDSPNLEVRDREHQLHSAEAISTTRAGKNHWTFGLRVENERFAQSLFKRSVLASGGVSESIAPEVPTEAFSAGAAYGQFDWRLDRFALLPGVRVEAHSRYGLVLAPRLAGSYKPTDDLIFRAAIGRGYRVPSAKEYGFAFDHSALGYMVTGNTELEPERSIGVTAEAQYRVAKEVRIRAGQFVNWVEGMIDTDFAGRDPATQVDTYHYVNVGRARTWGTEVDVEWQQAERIKSRVGYSYLGSRDLDRARPLVGRPVHTVKASTALELTARWSLDLRYRLVSESYIADGVTSPAFLNLGARTAYAVLDEAELYLGVDNALAVERDSGRPGDQRPMRGVIAYGGLTIGLPEL